MSSLPLAQMWKREQFVQEEFNLLHRTYLKVIERKRPAVEAPTLESYTTVGGDMFSWAESVGVSRDLLVERMIFTTGVPLLPLAMAHPTQEALEMARRMKACAGVPFTEPLPWLPVDTIGPFLVVGHFCPLSTNFAGLPEDMLIKVVLTRVEYDRIHSQLPEVAQILRMDRTTVMLPEPRSGDDLDAWCNRILNVGSHREHDAWKLVPREDAIERLKLDTVAMQALENRMAGIRMIPTGSLIPTLASFEMLPRKTSLGLPALCYYSTGEARHVLLADLSLEGQLQDELAQAGSMVRVMASYASEPEIRRLTENLSGREMLDLMGDVDREAIDKERCLEVNASDLAGLTEDIVRDMLFKEDEILNVAAFFLFRCVIQKSSDLHLDPIDNAYLLRNRVHGMLQEMSKLPLEAGLRLIAAIKGRAKLDQQKRQLPQDGQFTFLAGSMRIEIRVSTLPVHGQESMVLRLQVRGAQRHTMETIGMQEHTRKIMLEAIGAPYGIIVITGPTGSGKTTTLDAIMQFLNTPDVSIATMEQPVEMRGERMKQCEIRDEIHLTFNVAFRSILRQDPDIIMIGEVRDEESADAAIKAANTGHLVFCTMHTNDAPSIISRFQMLNVPSDLLASNLVLGQAQTLVRTVCSCATRRKITDEEIEIFRRAEIAEDQIPQTVVQHKGCPQCNGTGYAGRRVVMEMMPRTPELATLIQKKASYDELRACARRYGYRTLLQESLLLVAAQQTTMEQAVAQKMPFSQMEPVRI